jgi:hypothetical protein
MRCAIMQPTYLPWAGYLNLMASVDCFVYLDDAQFERSSWQHRNRLLVGGAPAWLTVPVFRGFLGETIEQVRVADDQPWRHKHLGTLAAAYGRHPFHAQVREAIAPVLEDRTRGALADLNMALLAALRLQLGIRTPLLRSSQLGVPGARTDRLIRILQQLGATEYVTPPGALGYLREDRFAENCGINLLVHDFVPAPYVQRGGAPFVSHLSIIDVAAHLGWTATASYIRPLLPAYRPDEDAT